MNKVYYDFRITNVKLRKDMFHKLKLIYKTWIYLKLLKASY